MLPSLHLQSNYNVKVSADNVLDIIVTVASFTSICTCPRHESSEQAASVAQDNDANEVLELFEDLSRTCLKTIDKVGRDSLVNNFTTNPLIERSGGSEE